MIHGISYGLILIIYKDETIYKVHGQYPLQDGGERSVQKSGIKINSG